MERDALVVVGPDEPDDNQCFTLHSADAAADVARANGMSADRIGLLEDCITHHITPGLPRSGAPLMARYLQQATLLDIGGARLPSLPRAYVAGVLDENSRASFERYIGNAWHDEVVRVPSGRASHVACWTGLEWIPRLGAFRRYR